MHFSHSSLEFLWATWMRRYCHCYCCCCCCCCWPMCNIHPFAKIGSMLVSAFAISRIELHHSPSSGRRHLNFKVSLVCFLFFSSLFEHLQIPLDVPEKCCLSVHGLITTRCKTRRRRRVWVSEQFADWVCLIGLEVAPMQQVGGFFCLSQSALFSTLEATLNGRPDEHLLDASSSSKQRQR